MPPEVWFRCLERPTGAAPASPDWESGALLLSYGREFHPMSVISSLKGQPRLRHRKADRRVPSSLMSSKLIMTTPPQEGHARKMHYCQSARSTRFPAQAPCLRCIHHDQGRLLESNGLQRQPRSSRRYFSGKETFIPSLILVRVARIELAFQVWKTRVLPLNHTRILFRPVTFVVFYGCTGRY